MKYERDLRNAAYMNNPEGFELPYDRCDPSSYEIYEWRYYRLVNFSKHPSRVRCNSFIYGDCDRQRKIAKW